MTTTTATAIKAPRAYMGTTSKNLVTLAQAEPKQEKITAMLSYASEKFAQVQVKHPTRAKRWQKAVEQISQVLHARSAGTPAGVASTFVQKPVAKKTAPAKKAAPAKATSTDSARLTVLEQQMGQILAILTKTAA